MYGLLTHDSAARESSFAYFDGESPIWLLSLGRSCAHFWLCGTTRLPRLEFLPAVDFFSINLRLLSSFTYINACRELSGLKFLLFLTIAAGFPAQWRLGGIHSSGGRLGLCSTDPHSVLDAGLAFARA